MLSVDTQGYLALALHAHLPYVRHPEEEGVLEENWLFEAVVESYIPLLWALERLAEDGIDVRLTLSLSPTLVTMLQDELLRRRTQRKLDLLCELAAKEVERTRHDGRFHATARMYRDRFEAARRDYADRWRGDLVGAFRRLQDHGSLEIITSGATHGYLPLLRVAPQAVRAQIRVAVGHYEAAFGRPPRGFWLPECGFYPGLDERLREAGIRYVFVDTHAITHGSGRPALGTHAPLYCPSGVAAFGRDPSSSEQVWSAQAGYPGDPDYREFYRDIGHDLALDYIGRYIQRDGVRVDTGIKYHRVTGGAREKEPYERGRALAKAALHARDFLARRKAHAEGLEGLGRRPLMVATYDAELFGHWWFEGPDWLEALFRATAEDPGGIRCVTPSDYLAEHPTNACEMPGASSWGRKGYHEVWLNAANDWIYPHLHAAAERMAELVGRFPRAEGLRKRALDQAARELLLAQASDWAFIMTSGTTVAYAVRRTKEHLLAFTELYEGLQDGALAPARLAALEERDKIFPALDYRVFGGDLLTK